MIVSIMSSMHIIQNHTSVKYKTLIQGITQPFFRALSNPLFQGIDGKPVFRAAGLSVTGVHRDGYTVMVGIGSSGYARFASMVNSCNIGVQNCPNMFELTLSIIVLIP